ncbi:MAG: phage major capsid protein [Deltaproteobacteria bacterium]|nr:MAG: phage major capsid protein [Deltaproteobacteria bacterium]
MSKRHQRQGDLYPALDESYIDFMNRCSDDIGDQDVCQLIWDDAWDVDSYAGASSTAKDVVYKTHASKVNGQEFVLSDETPDRMDDVIMADAWDLASFQKNPIALFNHNSNAPIGKWANVRVVDKQLRGHLELAPAGTSDRIDEIRKLIEADILRATSVGFRPKESKPRPESNGLFFTKAELVESSLVSVPANPNALAIAKSLKISPVTIDLVFAGKGKGNGIRRRGFTGGQADTSSRIGKGATMSLAQKIKEREASILDKTGKLDALHDTVGDGDYSNDVLETVKRANAEIAHDREILVTLRDSERNLATTSDDGGRSLVVSKGNGVPVPYGGYSSPQLPQRPFSVPAKKLDPIELFCRAGALSLLAFRERKPVMELARSIYGVDQPLEGVLEWQGKAASAAALTTVTGWAKELAQQIVVDFMEILKAASVYGPLSGMGLSLGFGRNAKIIIPTRSRTPTIAGSFVGEGLPIPVRQGAFTSLSLTPMKMAVITVWSRELDEHSLPAIQGLLRDAVVYDTSVAIDAVLLDANAATTIRPAGILNGVSGLTPTAGGGFTALTGDIKQLSAALLSGTLGNVRKPVWLMNPTQVNSAAFAIATGAGVFPYRDEIGQGRLGGWPIIQSGTVPAGTVIAIDAADFVTVGDGPRFEISDQATLHFDDTTPLDISTAGSPNVVAAPVKSMFQTDMLAMRMIMPMTWAIRRTGTVAWLTGVTW